MSPLAEQVDLPPWAAFGVRLARRLAVAFAFLLTVFIVLELMAFHFFPGRSTRFLITGESNGQPAWTDNPFFPYRFFPGRTAPAPLPVMALKTPVENTLRICLLGGSAAMGMPEPAFGLGRQLEHMLQRRYPGQTIEVIPMGLDDGNSHVLREVARDLNSLKPHAVVVLSGNDEVAGPYGPVAGLGRFHHSSRIARGMAIFSRTRLSQLLVAIINRTVPSRVDRNAWKSQEPISLRGRMAPQDPRLKTVQRSFRKNLSAILQAAAKASPVVVVCTVPVNLRDCSPFSTTFLSDEAVAQEVRETLRAAIAAEASTNRFEAARLYANAIQLNPAHAEALFRAARLALDENRTAEAAALFSRARDADALRLRADSRLNALIRECAAKQGVDLLDAEALFAIRSPQGIPGREFFLDHIHFTFEGTHLLASALLHRLEFLRAFDPAPTARIPSPGEMASEMLFHPWGRAAQLDTLVHQQLRPPFRRQLTNPDTLARLNEEQKTWGARVAAYSPENTRAIFARRQASRPDDAWMATRAAWQLLQAGDPVRAETAAEAAYARWPHRFDIRGLLALTRAHQGQDVQDGIELLLGPGGDSGYYDINLAIAIGRELHAKQRFESARPWLEYALERDPWNSAAAIALAETLYRLDLSDVAVQLLKDTVERNPRNPLLWEELAVLYTLMGDWRIAHRCYTKSEEIAPYRYERLLKWAEAMFRLRHYQRANIQINRYLKAMPDDPDALALQERILARLPSQPESTPEPAEEKSSRRFPWE